MVVSCRASGVLLHISSLPSAFGIGDLGSESYKFVDLLAKNKQRIWSILPLSPTRLEDGNSPYQTSSAFAGNPLLISPEKLMENELVSKKNFHAATEPADKVNYEVVYQQKNMILQEAYDNFKKSKKQTINSSFSFDNFCSENQNWLSTYALYAALRKKTGKPWNLWPRTLRKRELQALQKKENSLKTEIEKEKFVQYLFFSQWRQLKDYCKTKQINIIGDMPFYIAHDSADVWANPEIFCLKPNGKPQFVGGVPPDYFSATGQLWGNPVYDLQKLKDTDFQWWINRISHALKLYDKLRLDHFRGFVAYWQVAASAKTAKKGSWVKSPSECFFEVLKSTYPSLPFVAEDLGMIDEPVRDAIKTLGVPGMRVLLFAFDGAKDNSNLPQNHVENAVVYTSTHDTNTVKGWFMDEASAKEKRNFFKMIGTKAPEKDVNLEFVKSALASVADLSIIPLQDVLFLGSKARMNNPGKTGGNWEWRVTSEQLTDENFALLKKLTEKFNR